MFIKIWLDTQGSILLCETYVLQFYSWSIGFLINMALSHQIFYIAQSVCRKQCRFLKINQPNYLKVSELILAFNIADLEGGQQSPLHFENITIIWQPTLYPNKTSKYSKRFSLNLQQNSKRTDIFVLESDNETKKFKDEELDSFGRSSIQGNYCDSNRQESKNILSYQSFKGQTVFGIAFVVGSTFLGFDMFLGSTFVLCKILWEVHI